MGQSFACTANNFSCSANSTTIINPNEVDISHFEVLKLIGRGGFAEVYVSRHCITGEKMAIKRIKKQNVMVLKSNKNSTNSSNKKKNENWVLRSFVFTERNAMSTFTSPFLMPLVHAFQDKTALYLAMPFFAGGDLGYYIRKVRLLREHQAKFYTAEIILALEELHKRHHIVYRDLKPSNIMLSANGHICLADFGLCAQLNYDKKWQITGNVGTVGYQAPEIVQRKPYTFVVDIFALGVTIYRLITGKRPYGKKGIFDKPVNYSYFSPVLTDLLQGLLHLNPADRLGSTLNYEDISKTNIGVDWQQIKKHKWFEDLDWNIMKKNVTISIIW